MKRMRWLTAALMAAVLALIGCSNPTSDNGDDSASGVLGQIAGVVYNDVTGLPIEGATVTLGGTKFKTTTDESGAYLIENVPVGDYTLTVTKSGFTAFSRTAGVVVNPRQYIADDPYLEVQNAAKQIGLFDEWLDLYETKAAYPETDFSDFTDISGSPVWTYEDGVFVSGNGTTAVTYTPTDPAKPVSFPDFTVSNYSLSYSYSKGLRVDIIHLKPLTGGFTGQIWVVFEVHDRVSGLPLEQGAAPAKEGVEIYFTETRVIGDGIDSDPAARVKYGPYKTGANGAFTADGLPANTEFTLEINSFAQTQAGGEYFFTGEHVYTSDNWKNEATTFTTSVNREIPGETAEDPATVEQGHTDLSRLYLFTIGEVAYATASNVPNPNAPFVINPTNYPANTPLGAISITFNKPVDAKTIEAKLMLEAANGGIETTNTEQALEVSYNEETKTLTLTAGETLNGYQKKSFPYSKAAGKPVAKLLVTGYAKDGSPLYVLKENQGLPIYTEEALKVVGIEYITKANAPARTVAAFSEVGGAIKLTFNKALDTGHAGTKFTLGSGVADHKFDPDNVRAVFVYTDVINDADTGVTVLYSVAAKGDPADAKVDEDLLGSGNTLAIGVPQLLLTGTNLYTNRAGVAYTPTATYGYFPVDGVIEFEFASIPDGVTAYASLSTDSGQADVFSPVIEGNTVKVTPQLLAASTVYYLTLRILRDADKVVLYKSPTNAGPGAVTGPVFVTGGDIQFKTADNAIALNSVNLYTDRFGVSHTPGVTGYFPVDSIIEFEFGAIPDGSSIAAALKDGSVTVDAAAARVPGTNKVTITPAKLQPNTSYSIELRIIGPNKQILYTSPAPTTAGTVGPVYATTNGIAFKTADNELSLIGVNLYTGWDGIPHTPDANAKYFPVNGAIEFEFAGIPANSTAGVTLKDSETKVVYATAAVNGNTVTVTPAELQPNGSYFIELRIIGPNKQILYTSPALTTAGTVGPVYATTNGIAFKTADNQLSLIGVNLYTDSSNIPYAPGVAKGYFPVEGAIELTFANIPGTSSAGATLEDSKGIPVDVETTIVGNMVTVDPDTVLNFDETYTLTLQISDSARQILYTSPKDDDATGEAKGPVWATDAGIVFKTVDSGLVLTGANLYTDRSSVPYAPGVAKGYFPVDGSIVFTFAGAIPDGSSALVTLEGNGGAIAVPQISITNGNTITIDPVVDLQLDTEYTLTLTIYGPAQQILYTSKTGEDATGQQIGPVWVTNAGIVFKTAPNEFILSGVNLYTDRSGVPHNPAIDTGYFPVDGRIVFTFAGAIPNGSSVFVTLEDESPIKIATLEPEIDSNTVTIEPVDLKLNTGYDLTLTIYGPTKQILYTSPKHTDAVGEQKGPVWATDAGIAFKTAPSEFILSGANLYTDQDGIRQPTPTADPTSGEGIFPFAAGSVIEFNFNKPFPDGAKVVVKLTGAGTPTNTTATVDDNDRKKITITPAQLKRDTLYNLELKVLTSADRLLYEPATEASVYVSGGAIVFRTADVKPMTLLRTNLYIDPDTGFDAGAGNTPPDADQLYYFDPAGNIELTFDAAIPADASRVIRLREAGGNTVLTTVTYSEEVITIDPTVDLKFGATYYLSVALNEATGGKYYTIPVSSTVANILQPSFDNTNDYIKFNVRKVAREPVLVSANLYKDNNVADYNEWHFPRGETITLTFDELPAATKVADMVLATSSNSTTGISAYATVSGNSVTVKPTDLLDAQQTYHLKFTLKVGVNEIWSIPDVTGDTTYDPVRIIDAGNGDEIYFRTVERLAIVPMGANSLTNIATNGSATYSFATDNNIVLQFNQPVTVEKAELWYTRNTYFVGRTVATETLPADNLSADKKTLTITPANLLVTNGIFYARVVVATEDGKQKLVYDTTDTGDVTLYVGGKHNDFQINTANSHVTGPKKSPASISGLAQTTAGALNSADTTVDLTFTPPLLTFTQSYDLLSAQQGIWTTTAVATVTVNAGVVAPENLPTAPLPNALEGIHTTNENIRFKIRSSNGLGYVVESNAVNITFTP